MNWEQLVRLAKKEYGLKRLIWVRDKNFYANGTCGYSSGIVFLNHYLLKDDFRQKVCTLFHELGHIHCYKNGIWKKNHHGKMNSLLTKEEKRSIIRIGLRAERWIEKWAKKEVKKYFPNIRYPKGYFRKGVEEQYYEHFLYQYRETA